ncbi:MAG: nuclear transport factor 2 family protein [Saprospiraceae bacterium]|nr:nuclear transport factor 2 family protein [Saprospiraceae bacterium]
MILFIINAIFLLAAQAPIDDHHNEAGTLTTKDEVLAAEKSRFAAMVAKDLTALDKLIHDDLYYVHSNGSVDGKSEFIEAISSGKRYYNAITIEDPMVRVYGTTGIINAKCVYHRTNKEGKQNNLKLHYTSVYAKIDDRWQHVSWQSFRM